MVYFDKRIGIPASSSHALIGGVVGAGIAAFGTGAITWNYFWVKVVAMIFITPIVSFIVGFLIQRLLSLILMKAGAGVKANIFFKYMQWFNMTFLAFNHAYNDSQKSIGIVMVIIGIFGYGTGEIPAWVILLAAPVSASQIVSSSIMGVGSAERYKAVHWNVSGKILVSWFITIPIAGTLGALLYYVFSFIF